MSKTEVTTNTEITTDYYARKNHLNQCGVSRQSDAA